MDQQGIDRADWSPRKEKGEGKIRFAFALFE
jgi:hypothetical protein